LALALLLFAQTAFFAALVKRPLAVEGDNDRYEQAGWNVATGRGYALPLTGYGASNDPEVYERVCTRHPAACDPDTTHPSALYMPGYSMLVAGVYAVCGRSLLALCLAQLVLLWLLFALFERLAARLLGRYGYFFAVAVAATYPFLARQATMVMSDHLHAVLWLAAFVAFMEMKPGPWRGVLFGGLMAFATLCRPYSLFIFPTIWGLGAIWKAVRLSRHEWLAGALAFVVPFAVWTARNAYWYGRFLPMTTGGAGVQLYESTLEWDVDLSNAENGHAMFLETTKRYGDVTSRYANRMLMADALQRIHDRPWRFVEGLAIHVPRLWISMSSRLWFLSVLYLGGLLVLGLAGGWAVRRDARFYPLLLAIGVNWAFLLPFPGEARRTLPLRLPMLILAGVFVGPLIERLVKRQPRLLAFLAE
jgi:4-amino-4-deoxy-L-arabinose transferase-like glycosyltransferase